MIPRRVDGVVARSGEEATGEVWSLVVLPPNDAGQRREGGQGGGVEDVPGVERRDGDAASSSLSAATLIELFVKLPPVRVSESARIRTSEVSAVQVSPQRGVGRRRVQVSAD